MDPRVALLLIFGIPWFLDGIDALRFRRQARRECRLLDVEHEFLV